eukprot:GILI01031883.1.p1 GENE.GILI01031883.1~~GILI01031883.1.p1  ORF type:complete len:373 (-),score=5.05 GILI01031883.1:66-1184(-)
MMRSQEKEQLLFIGFNQEFSCISVGTKVGYKIFSCEPFQQCHFQANGGIGVVEMLYCTSLVALVGAGEQPACSPRRLILWNTAEMKSICELNFVTSILNVKLNRRRLVVVLENKIHIYDLSTMKSLHTLDTAPNPKGLCSLSLSPDSSVLAFPVSVTTGFSEPSAKAGQGQVCILDTTTLRPISFINAHQTALVALTLNQTGSLLATASDTGTVIRIFSNDGAKLMTLRRGTYSAHIYSMNFSLDSSLFCCSSDTGTIHIFSLNKPKPSREQTSSSSSLMSSATSMLQSYLPNVCRDLVEYDRDFASVRLRQAGVPNVCAINASNTQVMVVTSDGFFYQYTLDAVNGGECRLEREHLLLDTESEQVNVTYLL